MRAWRYWWTMPLLIFVGIVGPGLAVARADTSRDFAIAHAAAICSVLDDNPSVPGLLGVMQGVQDVSGMSGEAAQAVVLSIMNVCPVHQRLLDSFVAQYLPDRRVTV